LSKVSSYLISYGGHEGAGGFSIQQERLKGFCQAFDDVCRAALSPEDRIPVVLADTEVTLDELSIALVEQLETLAPFGIGNPSPVLLAKKLTVSEVRELRGGHLKAILSDGTRTLTAMMWRTPSHPAVTRGALVDVAFKLDVSSYLGDRTLQGTVQGVVRSGFGEQVGRVGRDSEGAVDW
jgi:single-stranded-DNA-specific exonuclease